MVLINRLCIYRSRSLTHWGRVTHICVSKLTSIGSDNGLSPGRRQAIIWTNTTGILLIRPLGTNLSEILIEIDTFSFKKMHLKMSSGKWRSSCLGLNVFMNYPCRNITIGLTNLSYSKSSGPSFGNPFVIPSVILLIFVYYYDVMMGAMASQITSLTIAYYFYSRHRSTKGQSSASLIFVRGI